MAFYSLTTVIGAPSTEELLEATSTVVMMELTLAETERAVAAAMKALRDAGINVPARGRKRRLPATATSGAGASSHENESPGTKRARRFGIMMKAVMGDLDEE
uniref:Uncharacterized protein n=1 Tax=Octactis speculum TaxID=3111310 RepID=A0A6U3RN79_9STRA|mmetsp:Transcript_2257/g.2646  ORF Transcript_2257/g.2646 Transcript_2257/m.2646 type:complete len:103 (+) Transcript_2257:288-596(+)|eukprot:CAMPEP_0185746810 /NCGR_PEP_ID=MMETSP1174-20130828/5461_1 /TAXON_ID=35687 /ORGANISM="Dictyocha speculum, Strain CCMP1381" /LENGTH=102 /DNA_ID=CAMNT_0028421713 /DNA_START=291 /DNA_END=599 /DNA_ORIENTATION=-